MKKIKLVFAAAVFLAAIYGSADAASDCIYSAEYIYDSGFEGAAYDSNCGWIPYHSTTTATAEIVTAKTAGEKAVFEGEHSLRFSNMPNQGSGRGVYYKPGVSGQTEWRFTAGDTVEMSGMFRTDAVGGAQVLFGVGSVEFTVQSTRDVGDEWTYISGRYTFDADGTANFRINTNIEKNAGYIYADNISIKRVLYSGEKSAAVRVAVKDGVYASIDAKGNLYMWGKSAYGVLNSDNSEVGKPMLKMTGVADIALGGGHAVVLKKGGAVYTWGRNDCGQLGDGTTQSRTEPIFVASGIKAVAAGGAHSVIVDKFGCAYGSGCRVSSQYSGSANPYLTKFQKIDTEFYVTQVWASGEHTFLKSAEGYIYGIGYNGNAQLGNGSFLPQLRYKKISENRLLDMDTTNSCTVCLGYDRVLYAAGFARHGQFGSKSAYETLTQISTNADICSIGEATMFAVIGGKATAAGSSSGGIAGDGSLPVMKLSNAVSGTADDDVLYLTDNGDLCNMAGIVLKREAVSDTPFPEWDGDSVILPFGLVFDLDGGIVYNAGDAISGVTVFVAAYDKSDNLVRVSMSGGVKNEKLKISAFDCAAAKYKVMIWNSAANMTPMEKTHLITFAQVSAIGSHDGNLWRLNVSGKTASIDGARLGETPVTLVVCERDADISNIKALEQVNTAADGSFECSLPLECAPSECILRVGISGGTLENKIQN